MWNGQKSTAIVVGLLLSVLLPTVLEPAVRTSVYGEDTTNESERAIRASRVLEELIRAEDNEIPAALLDRARAVAVIPHVVKGAFIVGGRFGKGLVSKRLNDGSWGAPLFVEISGGSVGYQIGAEATDLVLVFIEDEGIDALLEDRLRIGVDATAAAGPLGRNAGIGTNITLDAAIYSYSRSKGLFAGVALDGAVLSPDVSANRSVYGEGFDKDQILNSRDVPAIVAPFVEAIEKHTPETPTD